MINLLLLYKKLVRILIIFLLIFNYILYPVKVNAIDEYYQLSQEAFQETNQDDLVNILRYWDQYLEQSPKDSVDFSNQGNVRLSLGDFQGSIVDSTKPIELVPDKLDAYLNRGMVEEALQLWDKAIFDYKWILSRDPMNPIALYNLGNVEGAIGHWKEAEILFSKAGDAESGFIMARSNKALVDYQLGYIEDTELELRKLIKKYPMFADARAGLSALLWRKGSLGEAESNWVAVPGLDSRYSDENWLINIRRWPPKPTNDLMAFLALDK